MFWVIYKKELSSFFKSPLFYLIAFACTIVLSVTFAMGFQNFILVQSNAMYQYGASSQQLNIHYAVFLQHLSLMNLFFIFVTPALAMRLIAEEKKNRTYDLLLTSPITSKDIILGKYLAMLTVVGSLLLLVLGYVLSVVPMVDFSWTPTLITTLGIFLVAAIYSSLGLFASSLTDNVMVAFILGVVFNVAIWIFGGLVEVVDQSLLKGILEQLSMNLHFQSMIEGAIRLNGMIFFLSMIFFFCFLAERLVEASRWR